MANRRRFQSYLLGFFLLCLLGIATFKWIYPVDQKVSLDKIAYHLNQRSPLQNVQLTEYANKLDMKLTSPQYRNFAVNSKVRIEGSIGKIEQMSIPYLWVEIDSMDGKEPNSFQYYVPIKKKHFSQDLQLFAGKGDYQITIRAPSANDDEQFLALTSFRVKNVNPQIHREIEYSLNALEKNLQISQPISGYQKANQTFQLAGNVADTSVEKLLVQMKKGNQIWKRIIAISDGKFSEKLPLLFGQGLHEVKVMVPSNREGYFKEGITFYLKNESSKSSEPIRYTRLYHQRGIQLQKPLTSGDQADLTYRIKGRINPDAPYAKNTSHVIVQTVKNGEKATYFLPVRNYQFDDQIWFRFGPGRYKVILFVPDLENKERDFFRFYNVATFHVTSHTKKDQRHLLPSRGIQPDHPKIKQLAKEVTQGKESKRQQAKAIYEFVANYMTYDMEKLRNDGFDWDDRAIKSLETRKGVCQDYVFLALSMLRSLDIPSRFVEGEAGNQRHAWIEVLIDGQWITMDPTWGSGYIQNGYFVKRYDERYFDPSDTFFSRTHRRTGVVY